jgi:hypothetical protein
MNSALKKNPVFWLMWAIPAAAVLAGLGMVVVATKSADRALPDIYHWEGERLDADFERARAAVRLGLEAELLIVEGRCRLVLRGAQPRTLSLRFTSGSDATLDRALTLNRGDDGAWHADCAPLTLGKWRVALADADDTWALRTQIEAPREYMKLMAHAPEGPTT